MAWVAVHWQRSEITSTRKPSNSCAASIPMAARTTRCKSRKSGRWRKIVILLPRSSIMHAIRRRSPGKTRRSARLRRRHARNRRERDRLPCLFLQGVRRSWAAGAPSAITRCRRTVAITRRCRSRSLPPGTRICLHRAGQSGATLGTWRHRSHLTHTPWDGRQWSVNCLTALIYRRSRKRAAHAIGPREAAHETGDAAKDACRAMVEPHEPRLHRLSTPPGKCSIAHFAGWATRSTALPGELYQAA